MKLTTANSSLLIAEIRVWAFEAAGLGFRGFRGFLYLCQDSTHGKWVDVGVQDERLVHQKEGQKGRRCQSGLQFFESILCFGCPIENCKYFAWFMDWLG